MVEATFRKFSSIGFSRAMPQKSFDICNVGNVGGTGDVGDVGGDGGIGDVGDVGGEWGVNDFRIILAIHPCTTSHPFTHVLLVIHPSMSC